MEKAARSTRTEETHLQAQARAQPPHTSLGSLSCHSCVPCVIGDGHLDCPLLSKRETSQENDVFQSSLSAPRFSGLCFDGRKRLRVSVLESSRCILSLFQLPTGGKWTFSIGISVSG